MCHLTILYNSIAMQSFFKEIFVSPSYSNIHKQPAHKLKTINFTYVQCRLVYKQSIHVHWYLKQLLIKWVNIISPYHIYTKLPPFKHSLPFKYAKQNAKKRRKKVHPIQNISLLTLTIFLTKHSKHYLPFSHYMVSLLMQYLTTVSFFS